ncbi:hypothetical protein J3459_017411 [Metarhizium acridum]|nr:hypothetical protein J3459_017411 [Metarhizium acridum]
MQALDKNATGSYLDWTEMQLLQDVSEALERPLAIWEAEFKTLPEALPPLPMALVNSWQVAQQFTVVKSRTGSQGSHRVVQELGKD